MRPAEWRLFIFRVLLSMVASLLFGMAWSSFGTSRIQEVPIHLSILERHLQLSGVHQQHSSGWDIHSDTFSTRNPWKEQGRDRPVGFRPCFPMFCWPITELRFGSQSRRNWIRSYQWMSCTNSWSNLRHIPAPQAGIGVRVAWLRKGFVPRKPALYLGLEHISCDRYT